MIIRPLTGGQASHRVLDRRLPGIDQTAEGGVVAVKVVIAAKADHAARINTGASGATRAALTSPISGSARRCAALADMMQMPTPAAANESFRVAFRCGFSRRSTRRTTSGVLLNHAGSSDPADCV